MNINDRRFAIITSYILLILSAVVNILLTPFMLNALGIKEFGLYQLIFSFVGFLTILNFGTGVVTTRYVAKYRTEKDKIGEENFIATIMILSLFLFGVIVVIGYFLKIFIPDIFSNLESIQVLKAQKMFIILVFNIALLVIISNFEGITIAYEKYSFTNIIKLARLFIRTSMIVLLLILDFDIVAIAVLDICLTVITFVIYTLYCFYNLNIRMKLYKIDKPLLSATITFSLALFLQSVVGQANLNVDNIILGIMTTTSIVALYAIAMNILLFYSMLTSTIYNYYVPEAVKLVSNGVSGEELTNFVIKPGRFILIFVGAILTGFLLFGQNFIIIWVGKEYLEVWLIAIIIMIPGLIPIIQNVCVSILNAKNKRMFRSLVSVGIAFINVILTVILVKGMGYIGAPIATSLALIIGDVIIMNIYYSRVMDLKILRMFKGITKGILPSLIITFILCLPLALFLPNNLMFFVLKFFSFMIIYLLILITFGLEKSEKELFLPFIKKLNTIWK